MKITAVGQVTCRRDGVHVEAERPQFVMLVVYPVTRMQG